MFSINRKEIVVLTLVIVCLVALGGLSTAGDATETQEALVQKTTSIPPTGERSKTTLTWDEGTGTLSWFHYNAGDNDLNGEVNLADITPIAMHFKEVGPFDPNSIAGMIDVDGNGEINAADHIDIVRYYTVTCRRYNVYSGPAQDGPFILEGYGNAQGDTDRPQYFYTLESPTPGDWYYVVPEDFEGNEGVPSDVVGG